MRNPLIRNMKKDVAVVKKGLFPFGVYEGKKITSAPDNQIMYWVRCAGKNINVVALNRACVSVAHARGLI